MKWNTNAVAFYAVYLWMLFFHFGLCIFPGMEQGLEGGKSARCLWSKMVQHQGTAICLLLEQIQENHFSPAVPGARKVQELQNGSVHGGREPVLDGAERHSCKTQSLVFFMDVAISERLMCQGLNVLWAQCLLVQSSSFRMRSPLPPAFLHSPQSLENATFPFSL